ncbi:MAG TPA: zinc ribbon domain-containing protein [Phycisphaerae bacterium]|nr:zinc ribbon domain-containing protein [Phycisphaerae bacterium]
MPIYCYECARCGEVTELLRSGAGRARPRSAPCGRCGGQAARSYQAEAGAPRAAGCGEIRSLAAGVMPEQAADASRTAAARGLGDCVRFDPATGDAVFRDRAARLKAIKAMGLHDRNEIRG